MLGGCMDLDTIASRLHLDGPLGSMSSKSADLEGEGDG